MEGAVEGGIGDWDEVVTRYPYRKVRVDHLLSKELLFFGCSCTLWLVEYASVMLPAFLIMKIVRVKHTPKWQAECLNGAL